MLNPDEEDDDILVVPPSPPRLTTPSLSQVSRGGFFYQSPEHSSGITGLIGTREPPLPSLVEVEDGDGPLRQGLIRNPRPTLAQLNVNPENVVQVDEDSNESNAESAEPENEESVEDAASNGSSASRVMSDNDVIDIDETSNGGTDDEVVRPASPVPPADSPQHDSNAADGVIVPPVQETTHGENRETGNTPTPSATDRVLDTVPQPGPSSADTEGDGTPHPAAQVVQIISSSQDSPAVFRSPKRRRIEVPESTATSSTALSTVADDEDDANCCPICFEDWTTSGSHRLASLRCGHLFGQSCIEKWLRGQGGKCPHCNAKAKRQDIRVLYTKSIKAVDTTERDRALQELEKEKEARRKLELEAAHSRLQYQFATEECNKLKAELDRVNQTLQLMRSQSSSSFTVPVSQPSVSSAQSGTVLVGQFVLDKTIKIWEAGNCRVMANSSALGTLVVSQPSSSPLFPGFGIKKISTMDFKTSQFLKIHNKAIRDMCFHPTMDDGILLSASLDKNIKMTSVLSNTVIQSYEAATPVWSCVWNTDDRNYFYAGLMNGTVLEYDIRNTSEHLQELNREGHRSPVVSLQYIPRDSQAAFRPGGIVVGQLAQVSFYEKKPDDQYRLHMLPLDGSLSSLCFEPVTRSLLASFKPNTKYPTTRHLMCEMASANLSVDPTEIHNVCACNVIQTFHGGRTHTMLSKSALFPHPADGNRLLVCAGEEASSSMHIWDCSTGQMAQKLHTGGVVVDVCALQINQQFYLTALTDKQLKVHKWT